MCWQPIQHERRAGNRQTRDARERRDKPMPIHAFVLCLAFRVLPRPSSGLPVGLCASCLPYVEVSRVPSRQMRREQGNPVESVLVTVCAPTTSNDPCPYAVRLSRLQWVMWVTVALCMRRVAMFPGLPDQ